MYVKVSVDRENFKNGIRFRTTSLASIFDFSLSLSLLSLSLSLSHLTLPPPRRSDFCLCVWLVSLYIFYILGGELDFYEFDWFEACG